MADLRGHPVNPEHRPAAAPASRRKYLTILFSDLTDSTRLAGMMEAEDYAHLLEHLSAAYQEVIPQFGGTVVQISGDGLLAIFGYPETNEDDGRTAVRAALELHDRVRALDALHDAGIPLRLHTGIHSGLVLLNEGDAVRGRFELLGGSTNIASRLANAAEADEILVSEATLGPDQGMFQTEERRFLTLKGKEQPIAAFNIVGHAPVGTRFAARERNAVNPFIGRAEELDRLTSAVERAAAGRPTFVSVVGPPGVGKTRLVSELLARMGGAFRVYRGECDAHLGAEPLQPFLQILRSALDLNRPRAGEHQADAVGAALAPLGPKLEPHGPVLLHLLASGDSSGTSRRPGASSVSIGLRALIARLVEDGPLALFIDDWQWADDASRRLLEGLRDLSGAPLLVLLTMREELADDGFDNFERVVLGPFSAVEAETVIRNVLPNADLLLVGEMCTAAGGNPLFLEELCHSVAYGEEDFRSHRGSGWLDVLIESRFARLPDDQAHLLSVAAVIGNIIPVWLLEQVTGHGEEDPLVQALGDEDFIFIGERAGTLRFKHGITRDVIYDSVGLRERRALHIRIAEAFRERGEITGEEEFYEALAYHFGAGGDAASTAAYAQLAGDKAMERAALDRALIHYRAALDAIDRLPKTDDEARRWDKVARRFGLAAAFDPSLDQLPILEKAVVRAAARGDVLALALAEYWLGYCHFGLGHSREAAAHCQRAIASAAPLGDDGLNAMISLLLGQAQSRAGEYQAAIPELEKSIRALRGRVSGTAATSGFAFAVACNAMMLADLGRFAEAREGFEEALAAVHGAEHPVEASILSQYELVMLWQGWMDDAVRIAADAERVSARVKALYMYNRNKAAGAYARWRIGGDAADVAQLLEATAWLEKCGNDQLLSIIYGWLGEMAAEQGDVEAARSYAARALARARKGCRLGEGMALRAVARGEAQRGQFARAERYVVRAAAEARSRGSRHEVATNLLCAAEIALADNAPEKALRLIEEAEAAFAEMDMRWHVDQAARLRARAHQAA